MLIQDKKPTICGNCGEEITLNDKSFLYKDGNFELLLHRTCADRWYINSKNNNDYEQVSKFPKDFEKDIRLKTLEVHCPVCKGPVTNKHNYKRVGVGRKKKLAHYLCCYRYHRVIKSKTIDKCINKKYYKLRPLSSLKGSS